MNYCTRKAIDATVEMGNGVEFSFVIHGDVYDDSDDVRITEICWADGNCGGKTVKPPFVNFLMPHRNRFETELMEAPANY